MKRSFSSPVFHVREPPFDIVFVFHILDARMARTGRSWRVGNRAVRQVVSVVARMVCRLPPPRSHLRMVHRFRILKFVWPARSVVDGGISLFTPCVDVRGVLLLLRLDCPRRIWRGISREGRG